MDKQKQISNIYSTKINIEPNPKSKTLIYNATNVIGGWEKRIDRELNREFFYNLDTKEISWTLPKNHIKPIEYNNKKSKKYKKNNKHSLRNKY